MNDFPRKIWIDNTILDEFDAELCPESDIAYIRADIAYELRDAMVEFMKQGWAQSPLEGISAHSSVPFTKIRRDKISKLFTERLVFLY